MNMFSLWISTECFFFLRTYTNLQATACPTTSLADLFRVVGVFFLNKTFVLVPLLFV